MDQVNIIKPVIPQHIDHQFIGREIETMFVLLNERMYCFYQPGLAPVILHYPVADMPYRADGKNEFQFFVESVQPFEAIIHTLHYIRNRQKFLFKPVSGCPVTISNTPPLRTERGLGGEAVSKCRT